MSSHSSIGRRGRSVCAGLVSRRSWMHSAVCTHFRRAVWYRLWWRGLHVQMRPNNAPSKAPNDAPRARSAVPKHQSTKAPHGRRTRPWGGRITNMAGLRKHQTILHAVIAMILPPELDPTVEELSAVIVGRNVNCHGPFSTACSVLVHGCDIDVRACNQQDLAHLRVPKPASTHAYTHTREAVRMPAWEDTRMFSRVE